MAAKKPMKYNKRATYYSEEKYKKVSQENQKFFRLYFNSILDEEGRHITPETEYIYRTTLQAFLIYLYEFKDNMSVLKVDAGDIAEYFDWYMTQRNNCKVDAGKYMMRRIEERLNSFYNYLLKRKFIPVNPFQFVKRVEIPDKNVKRRTKNVKDI